MEIKKEDALCAHPLFYIYIYRYQNLFKAAFALFTTFSAGTSSKL